MLAALDINRVNIIVIYCRDNDGTGYRALELKENKAKELRKIKSQTFWQNQRIPSHCLVSIELCLLKLYEEYRHRH